MKMIFQLLSSQIKDSRVLDFFKRSLKSFRCHSDERQEVADLNSDSYSKVLPSLVWVAPCVATGVKRAIIV
jgi:hypothetical protein